MIYIKAFYIFVAKIYDYALIDSFWGFRGFIDSLTSYATLTQDQLDGKDKDDDHDNGADDVQEDQDDDGGHLVTALVWSSLLSIVLTAPSQELVSEDSLKMIRMEIMETTIMAMALKINKTREILMMILSLAVVHINGDAGL